MGIYLDTLEDNDELSGWKIEQIREKLGIRSLPSRELPSIICPICQSFFFTEVELNNHIFERHRHEYVNKNLLFQSSNHQAFNELELKLLKKLEAEIESLQVRIDRNDRTVDDEWWQYQDSIYTNTFSLSQYQSGLLEYLRGHDLEVNRHSRDFDAISVHFGSAYGKLQPFTTPLAQLACRAIAFKMNWFNQHLDVSENSVFFLAWHFFTQPYDKVKEVDDLPPLDMKQPQGIILDAFHSDLLEAIKMYYSDRSKINYNWVYRLDKLLEGISNQNYLYKFSLFKARMYREWGDVHKAKEAYRMIKNHPEFRMEVKTFNG